MMQKNFKKAAIYICLALIILSVVILPINVLAFDKDFFSGNDVLFYDPDACGTASDNDTGGAINSNVVAIGDSLLLRDKSKLEDKLKASKYTDITIDAQSSRSIYQLGVGDNGKSPSNALDAIQANKAKIATAGTIVIVLGTNQDNFEEGIPELMKSIRKINENNRVYWVNTANTNADAIDGANKINETIKKYSTKTNGYSIVDWNKAVFGNGSTDSNNLLDGSGYHQSPAGIEKHVSLIIDAIGEPPDDSGGNSLTGKNNKERIWCYFRNKGLSKQSTAGIMGNLQRESGFSPCKEQSTLHCHKKMIIGTGVGYGIAQFTWPATQQALHDMMVKRGYPDRDDILSVQLDFIYKGLSTDAGNEPGWQVLKPGKTPTVYEATKAFMLFYERPSDQSEAEILFRKEFSDARLAELGDKTCGSSTGGGTGASSAGNSDSVCCATSTSGSSPVPVTSGSTVEQNQANTWNYFIDKGLTPIQTAGIMGNIAAESGFYPDRVQSKSPEDGSKDPASVSVGWGLIQWTPGSRIIGLASNAGITTPIYELQSQLDLIWWHMNHTSPTGVQNMLKNYYSNPKDEKEAARLFEEYVEGAGVTAYPVREAAASAALKKFGDSQAPSSSSCPGSTSPDGKVVTIDGYQYALPVSREIVGNLPCKQTSCHGAADDGAADLGITPKSEGTPVYAITSGEIYMLHHRGMWGGGSAPAECMSFQIKGDDGWVYWNGHIRNVIPKEGEKVQAGQKIAEIGQSACADNTPPHLHIDRGSPKGAGGGIPGQRDIGFVALLNKIWEETK